MPSIEEGRLRFDFSDKWHVIKYDATSFYKKLAHDLPETKGVDIVAFSGDELVLIEVKDVRNYRIENKKRIESHKLVLEAAQKFRDSLAGIVAANRREVEELKPIRPELAALPSTRVVMVLHLEESFSQSKLQTPEKRRQEQLLKLKSHLKPFKIRCRIENSKTQPTQGNWDVQSLAKDA